MFRLLTSIHIKGHKVPNLEVVMVFPATNINFLNLRGEVFFLYS